MTFTAAARWAEPSRVCVPAGRGVLPGPWSPAWWAVVGKAGLPFITSYRVRGGGAFLLPLQGTELPVPLSPPTATSTVTSQWQVRGQTWWALCFPVPLSSLLQKVGIRDSPRCQLLLSSPCCHHHCSWGRQSWGGAGPLTPLCLVLQAQLSEALEELGGQKQRADMVSP